MELGQYVEVVSWKGTSATRGGTHTGVPMVCMGVLTFGHGTEVRYLCSVLSHLGCC